MNSFFFFTNNIAAFEIFLIITHLFIVFKKFICKSSDFSRLIKQSIMKKKKKSLPRYYWHTMMEEMQKKDLVVQLCRY
jgi:hypothetical protein